MVAHARQFGSANALQALAIAPALILAFDSCDVVDDLNRLTAFGWAPGRAHDSPVVRDRNIVKADRYHGFCDVAAGGDSNRASTLEEHPLPLPLGAVALLAVEQEPKNDNRLAGSDLAWR